MDLQTKHALDCLYNIMRYIRHAVATGARVMEEKAKSY
jgi:hypothetical protein